MKVVVKYWLWLQMMLVLRGGGGAGALGTLSIRFNDSLLNNELDSTGFLEPKSVLYWTGNQSLMTIIQHMFGLLLTVFIFIGITIIIDNIWRSWELSSTENTSRMS